MDVFTIEILEYDDETSANEWHTYTQTPIFEQASAIMKHLAEQERKARACIDLSDDNKHYFFNYDIKTTPAGVMIEYLK